MEIARRIVRLVARAASAGLDAVVPHTCLSCDAVVAAPGGLCAPCWRGLDWIDRPFCESCGMPFEADLAGTGAAPRCAACLTRPGPLARVRSALRYDDASRGLVLAFKHADRTQGAPHFGRWMARAGADALAGADLVAPVPLHWTRLAWRRFNQSALLAHALAHATGVPCVPDLLVRARRTRSQGELGRTRRLANVRRAFAPRARHAGRIAGAYIVLVDDVLTTGATLGECAKALRRAGAAEVRAVTLARVVRPGDGG